MNVQELNEEQDLLQQVLADTYDRRARAWANFDDEEEQLLTVEIEQLTAQLYEIEQMLEARA